MWSINTQNKHFSARSERGRGSDGSEKRGDRFLGLHNEIKKLWALNQTVRTDTFGGRTVRRGPVEFAKKIIVLTDSLRYDDWTIESGDIQYRYEEEQMFLNRSPDKSRVWLHLPSNTILPNPPSKNKKERDLEPRDIPVVFALHFMSKSDHLTIQEAFKHLEDTFYEREGDRWPLGRIVNVVNGKNGYTILCRAAYFLNYRLLQSLLSRGADADFRNNHDESLDVVLEQGIRDAKTRLGDFAVEDSADQCRNQLRYWRERQQRLIEMSRTPSPPAPKKWLPRHMRNTPPSLVKPVIPINIGGGGGGGKGDEGPES